MKIGALPNGSMITTSVMNASANARQLMATA
jgi:MFS superfamily sulfate permease-like transporter